MIDFSDLDMLGVNQENLGVQIENELHTTDVNFIVDRRELQRKTFGIEIYFGDKTGETYERFNELAMFLDKTPYTLVYETPTGEWSRECELSELTKSLAREENILIEELQLDFITPWFKSVSEHTTIVPPIEGKAGKVYEAVVSNRKTYTSQPNSYREGDLWEVPDGELLVAKRTNTHYEQNDWMSYAAVSQHLSNYVYPYVYGATESNLLENPVHYYTYDYIYDGYGDGQGGVYMLNNDSLYMGLSIASPVEITIHGPCENPYWQIVVNSEIVQSDGFHLQVLEGYKLVVSSIPQSQRAVLIAPDGTTSNVYQQQDLGKTNFVTIPVGHSRMMFFNCDKISFNYRQERMLV